MWLSQQVPVNFRLLVGLGNPTEQYQRTRHNAGFWFIDQVSAYYRLEFRREVRFGGAVAKMDLAGEVLYLLKPATFMNRSGESVSALARFLKLDLRQILVAHDDLDLPPGAARLKFGGGHGGHNGLRNIVSCLGTADFYRLRFGIGHPGDRSEVVGYVLGAPPRTEEQRIQAAITRVISLIPELLTGGLDLTTQRLHS